MDWIKSNYDRVALIAAAVFLFLCSLSIWRSGAKFDENFAALQTGSRPKEASPPATAVELDQAAEKLKQPPQWTFGGRSGLFVPEKHFIGSYGLPAAVQTT